MLRKISILPLTVFTKCNFTPASLCLDGEGKLENTMQDLILSFLSENPAVISGLIVYLITTEVLPFVPGTYNGVLQGVIQGIADYLANKK